MSQAAHLTRHWISVLPSFCRTSDVGPIGSNSAVQMALLQLFADQCYRFLPAEIFGLLVAHAFRAGRSMPVKLRCNENRCIHIYLSMNQPGLPVLPCMCGSFRRTSRALTQLYEKAFRQFGLRATQFTILQVLSQVGEVSQGQLGEMLAMDSTSLTRTLAVMRGQGWIRERRGEDRRERWLGLGSAGKRKLRRALPVWERTQSQLRQQLGGQVWNNLLQVTRQVTGIATTQGGSL